MSDSSIQMAERIELWPVDKLVPYARNARTHSSEQVDKIAASIIEFGFTNPVLVDGDAGIIAGHGRLMAAKQLGMEKVPVVELSHLSDEQKRAYILADNRLALDAGWDEELLADELAALAADGFDLALTGFSDDELADLLETGDADGPYSDGHAGGLSDKFGVPPFTVLDARQGYWQDRKRLWLGCGIESEKGRAENLISYSKASTMGEKDTSIFDPVMAELAYRWFSPKGGLVLDPFAGGSVRGIVAALLDRDYVGMDLRQEQVEANREQAEQICRNRIPVWHCGDSQTIDKVAAGVEADFLFTCPPYADLEQYSDNPADLSNMDYPQFKEAYRNIIARACSLLKDDRFACIVVGDVRASGGGYYNFVSDTIEAFLDAGLMYYNEAILVTAIGSLPLRAGKMFSASRKLGKTHQNVLVFCKGDPKLATEACGEVEVQMPEGMEQRGD